MTAALKIAKGRKKASPFARIEDAIAAFRAGEIIIVCDDEDRENEGDLTLAADKVTPAAINFMAKHGRGLICMPMTGERLDELDIPLMVNDNTARLGTAFCVTIEAKHSTSTGISAGDRANTVLAAIDPKTKPTDLARPGHMFPLRAQSGGVLVRAGQTEAAVDLARIGGMYPAGVICEIMNDDGSMARVPELTTFAKHRSHECTAIRAAIRFSGIQFDGGGGVFPAALIVDVVSLSGAAGARSAGSGWPAPARTPRSTGGSTAPGCSPLPRGCRPASGSTSRSAAR